MATAVATPPATAPATPAGTPSSGGKDDAALWKAAQSLICDVRIEVKVPVFTVRDLLNLERKSLVVGEIKYGSNVPIHVNDLILAWSEFEVVGERLAVRIMEFA